MLNNDNITEKINIALNNAAGDNFNEILSSLEKNRKKGVKKIMSIRYKTISIIAASLALVIITSIFGFNMVSSNMVDSIIGLDVNPSINLQVNSNDKIIKSVALNKDAEIILNDLKLNDTDLTVGIYAIIGSMLKNGYITDIQNSILVTVDNKNTEKGKDLLTKLTQEIDTILQSNSLNGAIISQITNEDNNDIEEKAKANNISIGKALMIEKIINGSTGTATNIKEDDFESLSKLSINDLNLLQDSSKYNVDDITVQGNSNNQSYISMEKAKKIAFDHFKVSENLVNNLEVDFDFYGKMIYEIEFDCNKNEYEIKIDATSGEIIDYKSEKDDDYYDDSNNNTNQNTSKITSEQARDIALNYAKANVKAITKLKVNYDKSDNEYDVEFTFNNKEYDFTINAASSKIVSVDVDKNDDDYGDNSANTQTQNILTSEKVRNIALDYVKANVNSITNLKISYDKSDNEYEVDFIFNNKEYDFTINATSGKIISVDTDNLDNDDKYNNTQTQNNENITKTKARDIALNYVKANINSVTHLKISFDNDDNEYEVDFTFNNKEYDFTINASSGKIKNVDVENLDNYDNNYNSSQSTSITKEKAKNIALDYAKANINSISKLKVSFDNDDNEYEVDFTFNNKEYDFTINATSGKIVNVDIENLDYDDDHDNDDDDDFDDDDDNYNNKNANITNLSASTNEMTFMASASLGNMQSSNNSVVKKASSTKITKTKARDIALAYLKISANSISRLRVDYDYDDNEYDVDFTYNKKDYDFTINATSGKIIKIDIDNDDDYYNYSNHTSNTGTNKLTKTKARDIALSFVKATVNSVNGLRIEYDDDDNEYDVNFYYNKKEYEITINGYNGKIVEVDVDNDNDYNYNQNNTAKITKTKARDIALSYVKATVNSVSRLRIDYDYDDNEYDVDFTYNKKDYDFTISAKTGKITKVDIDNDDNYYNYNNQTSNTGVNKLTKSKARDIAINYIKANVNYVTDLTVYYDYDDNEYDIDFTYNKKDYEITVNGYNGKIIEVDVEYNYNQNTTTKITKTKARDIALNYVKANINSVTRLKISYDSDDREYEVEFTYNKKDYDFTIKATTGKIIDYDVEYADYD